MKQSLRYSNHTQMDKAACRDFLQLAWPKNGGYMRIILLAAGVFALVYAVLQILAFGTAQLWYALGFVLMGAAALFLGLRGWLLRLGVYTKTQKKLWGGPTLDKTVDFYETEFAQKSKLGEMKFGYEHIDTLRQNKTALLIGMGAGALLIKVDGFAENEYPAFLRFLAEKCGKKTRKNHRVKQQLKNAQEITN